MKTVRFIFAALLLASIVIGYQYLWLFDPILYRIYDVISQQPVVEKVDLTQFQTLKFDELPESEKLKFAVNTCAQFQYRDAAFIKIVWFERYKNVVGKLKAFKLMTPDRLMQNTIKIPDVSKTQYLLIDEQVLSKYHELITTMEMRGLNADNISIASAFRSPRYNKIVGGVECSQHQIGTALDVWVGDVNNDGQEDSSDSMLVYDSLDKNIIRNGGGLGKYKNHPKLIHFDTRGYRARW